MPECDPAARQEMGTIMDRLILPRLDTDTPFPPVASSNAYGYPLTAVANICASEASPMLGNPTLRERLPLIRAGGTRTSCFNSDRDSRIVIALSKKENLCYIFVQTMIQITNRGATMKGRITAALAVSIFSYTALYAAQELPQSAPQTGSSLGSVTGGVFTKAHMVIDKKCVSCHTAERIESAIAAGKDMEKIQHRMQLKGAKLTADEQTVLGIFYKESPLKPKK
jgi:hypothetical protein